MPLIAPIVIGLVLLRGGFLQEQPESPPAVDLGGFQHEPSPCMDTDQYPLVEVRAPTLDAARRASGLTLHFKAEADGGWYEIPFQPAGGVLFHAALPRPLPEAGRVVYYFTAERPEVRSPEYLVNVLMGGCPGERSASAEAIEEIRVRRRLPSQPEIPQGFSPEGIKVGGGASATTLGIIAGAAGGAGLAGLVITGEDTPAPPPDPGGGPQAVRACFTPDPIPDIDSGDRILFDASCTTPSTVTSYQWSFGDGQVGQGSSVEHLFRPGGTYTVTLTASEGGRSDSISRVVHVRATPTACFITSPDPPRIVVNSAIDFNADCSLGDRDGGSTPIVSYTWDFGDGGAEGSGRFVSHLFTQPDLYGVTLTVTNEDGRQDRTTQFVVVERRSTDTAGTGTATVTSELSLPPGSSGQLSFNQAETVSAVAPAPQQHRFRARLGENVVEGRLLSESASEGRWRIDFRATPGFVPGSIRVDAGDVLGLDAHSVVFRVATGSGPPVRFRFEMRE